MRITYRDLLSAKSALESLLQIKPSPSARLAAQIARNVRLADQALRDVDTARDLMLKPYRDENGKVQALAPDVEEALNVEYKELLDTEVVLEVHPLHMADIEAVEKSKPGFEIPTAMFFVMPWMFED